MYNHEKDCVCLDCLCTLLRFDKVEHYRRAELFRDSVTANLLKNISDANPSLTEIDKNLNLYQVSFYRIYPDCTTGEEDSLIAFVWAESMDHASEKVKEKYKKEYESARIFGVSIPDKVEIIS